MEKRSEAFLGTNELFPDFYATRWLIMCLTVAVNGKFNASAAEVGAAATHLSSPITELNAAKSWLVSHTQPASFVGPCCALAWAILHAGNTDLK